MSTAPDSSKIWQLKVQDIFERCCDKKSAKKQADFVSTVKALWTSLDNSLCLVDLAGVWAITISNTDDDRLDFGAFTDFLNGISKLKYPTNRDEYCQMFIDDVNFAEGRNRKLNFFDLETGLDRSIIHELFKVDHLLKKAFSSFAGDSIPDVTFMWEEVKRRSLGIEMVNFGSFTEVYSICPGLLSTERCASIAKDVFEQYPLLRRSAVLALSTPALLYPQFELLMCFLAADIQKSNIFSPKATHAVPGSINSLNSNVEISPSQAVSDFFTLIKISEPLNHIHKKPAKNAIEDLNTKISSKAIEYDSSDESLTDAEPQISLFASNCVDQYTGSLKHSRQASLYRLQTLFETVEKYFLDDSLTGKGPSQALVGFVKNSRMEDTVFSGRQRFASKPVVISDAIPMPVCPLPVEQLLHSALAHHNLGSFKETILFLEAAKTQFVELSGTLQENDVGLPIDFDMYVLLSKGNLYRSCGEDESAMLCYMEGWDMSREQQTAEWDIIFVNSIGVLAYYLVRYDIALLCFNRVVRYREEVYGSDSSDTATALNNEGCSLFCMHERGEARLRFERCWLVGSKVLGHRAPRSIMMWQNLEKARRSNAAGAENRTQREEMKDRVCMRPDSEKLLVGGTFAIKAVAPPTKAKGKKKIGGKKKKK